MRWAQSHRFDVRALPLADRHYNRRKVGSPQFVPPGRCLVLLTPEADALWVTSWPFAEYVKHAWAGAWVNSLFRNESPHLSSELIREAIGATCSMWTPPPPGLVTFVDARKIQSSNPGYCYIKAGFRRVGKTKGGLAALQMLPEDMPEAAAPMTDQLTLFAEDATYVHEKQLCPVCQVNTFDVGEMCGVCAEGNDPFFVSDKLYAQDARVRG